MGRKNKLPRNNCLRNVYVEEKRFSVSSLNVYNIFSKLPGLKWEGAIQTCFIRLKTLVKQIFSSLFYLNTSFYTFLNIDESFTPFRNKNLIGSLFVISKFYVETYFSRNQPMKREYQKNFSKIIAFFGKDLSYE